MRTTVLTNLMKSVLILLLLASVGVGCSKKEVKKQNPHQALTPIDTTPVDGVDETTVYAGGTAPVDSFSPQLLEEYAGRRINDPKNLRVTLDVFNVADTGKPKQYGGTFKIIYEDGTWGTISGNFESGTSEHDTRYNKFYATGGVDKKLKLFFQDGLGSVIVSIEPININDLETKYKGRVYFRNFDAGICANPPPYMLPQCNVQSQQKCWNISLGPYDCRAYLHDGHVRPDIIDVPGFGSRPSEYSGPGYKQLFTFTNMDLNAALNVNLD